MKIYNTLKEVEADIVDGVLRINYDVTFNCDIDLPQISIIAWNIIAKGYIKVEGNIDVEGNIGVKGDIIAGNINAETINAEGDINAWHIDALNIKALNIKALDINAWDIDAGDINAGDINAVGNINAKHISYYAYLIAYNSIRCTSYTARRNQHAEPICLDGELEIIEEDKSGEGEAGENDKKSNF